jgi:hypothetical protein
MSPRELTSGWSEGRSGATEPTSDSLLERKGNKLTIMEGYYEDPNT